MTRQQELAAMLLSRDEDGQIGGGSMPWARKFVEGNTDAEHEGDCPHAKNKRPVTCSRCVVDRAMSDAHKIMTSA